jgi:hypothetical protein
MGWKGCVSGTCAVLAASVLVGFPSPSAAEPTPGLGAVGTVRGSKTVDVAVANGPWTRVRGEAPLAGHTVVRTGPDGEAGLRLDGQGILALAPRSLCDVGSRRGGGRVPVRLRRGELRFRTRAARLDLRTGTASVRAADVATADAGEELIEGILSVGPSGETEVHATRGALRVASRSGGEVRLEPGQQAAVGRGDQFPRVAQATGPVPGKGTAKRRAGILGLGPGAAALGAGALAAGGVAGGLGAAGAFESDASSSDQSTGDGREGSPFRP